MIENISHSANVGRLRLSNIYFHYPFTQFNIARLSSASAKIITIKEARFETELFFNSNCKKGNTRQRGKPARLSHIISCEKAANMKWAFSCMRTELCSLLWEALRIFDTWIMAQSSPYSHNVFGLFFFAISKRETERALFFPR